MRSNTAANLLASVGLDDQNSLAICAWQSGVLLARASTNGTGRITAICFQQAPRSCLWVERKLLQLLQRQSVWESQQTEALS